MKTKSTRVKMPSTLLEEAVERTRMSWLQVALAVGLVLVLLLVGTAALAGVLAAPFDVDSGGPDCYAPRLSCTFS